MKKERKTKHSNLLMNQLLDGWMHAWMDALWIE